MKRLLQELRAGSAAGHEFRLAALLGDRGDTGDDGDLIGVGVAFAVGDKARPAPGTLWNSAASACAAIVGSIAVSIFVKGL